jgi:ribosomal protein S21
MSVERVTDHEAGIYMSHELFQQLKARISGSIAAHVTAVTGMIQVQERKKLAEAIKRFRKGAEEAQLLKGLYMRTYQEMMATGRAIHIPPVKRIKRNPFH